MTKWRRGLATVLVLSEAMIVIGRKLGIGIEYEHEYEQKHEAWHALI